MRRIAQISDLHFGRFDPGVSEGLFATLTALKPDFVIVSGDLTQRAKAREFIEAKNYLDRLEASGLRYMVIPGNHDIAPFYKPLSRLFRPFNQYRKYISDRTQFFYADDEVAVTSINTVRRSHIENGRVTKKQVEETRLWLTSLPKHIVKMVVTHHPLYRSPFKQLRTPAWRIGHSITALKEAGVDVFISGHLHRTSFRRTDALIVQAGTVSERLRGEMPSFNLLTLDVPHCIVETYRWDNEVGNFMPGRQNVLLIKNKPAKKVPQLILPAAKRTVSKRKQASEKREQVKA